MMRSGNLLGLLLGAIVLALASFALLRSHRDSDGNEQPVPVQASAPVAGKLEPREEASAKHGPESADKLAPQLGENAEPDGDKVAPDLPGLSESDPPVRDRLTGLSAKPQWRKWLANEQLVRKATSFIAQLAKGDVDRRAVSFLAPKGTFAAAERSGGRYVMNPAGYQRYNAIADVIESLDARAVFEVYREFDPLFQAAFAELGFAGRTFDATLEQALAMLLAAPVLKGEVELIRPSVMYKFADPELEALPAAQKQLIRMGPRNMQKIQDKLRTFKAQFDDAKDQ